MPYLAKMVELTGAKDGVNTVFVTPGGESYVAAGNVVFVRGLPRVPSWDDGWTNTDPATGVVTLKEAPEPGDSVQMLYAVEVDFDVVVMEGMDGGIVALETLGGTLEDTGALAGGISLDTVGGTIEDAAALAGGIAVADPLGGEVD